MKNQLISFLNKIKVDLINSKQAKGSQTSTKSLNDIKITIDGDKLQLELPGFLQILENGRGPTNKNATPGVPPMINRIKQWAQEKGIPENRIWAIKKAIDKHGFKGKPGIISDPLSDENINIRLKPAMEAIATELARAIEQAIVTNDK